MTSRKKAQPQTKIVQTSRNVVISGDQGTSGLDQPKASVGISQASDGSPGSGEAIPNFENIESIRYYLSIKTAELFSALGGVNDKVSSIEGQIDEKVKQAEGSFKASIEEAKKDIKKDSLGQLALFAGLVVFFAVEIQVLREAKSYLALGGLSLILLGGVTYFVCLLFFSLQPEKNVVDLNLLWSNFWKEHKIGYLSISLGMIIGGVACLGVDKVAELCSQYLVNKKLQQVDSRQTKQIQGLYQLLEQATASAQLVATQSTSRPQN